MEFGEIVPLAIGVIVAIIVSRIPTVRIRSIAWGILSVLGGVLATVINSEEHESWAFALVDIALVAGMAAIVYGLLHLAMRRMAQSR